MATIQTLAAYESNAELSNRLFAMWAGRWFDVAKDWTGEPVRHTRLDHPDGANTLFNSDRWGTATITNSAGTVFLVAGTARTPRCGSTGTPWGRRAARSPPTT